MVRLRSPAPVLATFLTGVFPSGQRGQTVNLLSLTSLVRIQPLPPQTRTCNASPFLFVVGVASSDSLFVFENENLVRSLLQSRCQLASIRLGAKLTLVRIQPLRLTYSWNWESLLKNKVSLTPIRCPFLFVVGVSSSDSLFVFRENKNLVRSFAIRVGVCLQAEMRAKASALPRIQPLKLSHQHT